MKKSAVIGGCMWACVAMACGSSDDLTPADAPVVSADASDAEAPSGDADDEGADTELRDDVASAPEVAGDPGRLGAYPVAHLEVRVEGAERSLPTQVWYPAAGFDDTSLATYVIGAMGPFELEMDSDYVQSNVPAAEGAFPLIIFSHGYGGISTQSLDLCERLASHGFIVASAAHIGNTAEDDFEGKLVSRDEALADRPRDVKLLIDTFESQPPAALAGHVDLSRVGVTGHSFGGYTALTAAAGHAGSEMPADARVKAIAPICPDSSEFTDEELSAVTVPVLFVGGTLDTSTPIDPQITRPFDLMTDAPRLRVDVLGATHTHFANICTIADALMDMGLEPESWEDLGAGALLEPYAETCSEDAFPVDEAIRIQTHYIVAFFKTHLVDEPGWSGVMTDDYASRCEPAVALFSDGGSVDESGPECLSAD